MSQKSGADHTASSPAIPRLFLRKKISDRVASGHPWVFSNELGDHDGKAQPGDIIDLHSYNGSFVGRGYYNPASQIRVRLLSRKADERIDAGFFKKKIQEAWDYRQRLGYVENCRLIFGEADGLPALIVDKFGAYFVLQTLALGIDRWKAEIVVAIQELFAPAGIYERNDVPVRELEGMPQQKGFLSAPFDPQIIIQENGLQFHVDLENGQKTGYFLDQQDNRRAIEKVVRGAEVLGAFTYTGTFEIHAAHYGAQSVLGLDISEQAVAQANRNAALNNLQDRCHFEARNAFDMLKQWAREGRQYDVVMLDPPAFTKSREHIQKAVSGYKEINLRGIKLIRPGGFLISSSCTNLVPPQLFLDTLSAAAKDAHRSLRQVCFQTQSADHPVLWNVPSTQYLKFVIAQVL